MHLPKTRNCIGQIHFERIEFWRKIMCHHAATTLTGCGTNKQNRNRPLPTLLLLLLLLVRKIERMEKTKLYAL